jgi:uncharacterized membrane protein
MALGLSVSSASGQNPTISQTVTLTAYLDGYVMVAHELQVNQSYPSVNVSLLCETYENLLIVDESDLPLDFSISDGDASVSSLGSSAIKVSYLTQDLTSKTGKYWTLSVNAPVNTTVILPEAVTIISLNDIPDFIETSDGQMTLVMPSGTIEITYVSEHTFSGQAQDSDFLWASIAVVSAFSISAAASAVWVLKRKKNAKSEEPQESVVDIDKLFEREKDLRPEEAQVLRFLADKNGKAFEAELYEKLNLPRTTTWRLLKRLEKMEIVDIRKSRRQNIISIRKKYLRKT